jgi:hypothetical protein
MGLLLASALAVLAHETDNFFLPLDTELADLGDFLEAAHTIALEETAARINARIERAIRIRGARVRARALEKLHDPETLADELIGRFSHPMFEDTRIEQALSGKWARRTYAGRKASHQNIWMHFSAYAPLDPRRWTILTQSRTVKACGIYFGTDKLVHFHRLGSSYYRMYRALIKEGLNAEAAYRKVLTHYTEDGILSEQAIFGTLSTGIYSNADLAVNHIGFKFFMNLTDEIVLQGRKREPLMIRCGVFWQLNRHIRVRSGWFAAFVSDHWNEALNPSYYQLSMRPGIRRVLENRAQSIVRFYCEIDRRPNDALYFDRLARELSTCDGEDYGHSGHFENLMTIGNTCFPALGAPYLD